MTVAGSSRRARRSHRPYERTGRGTWILFSSSAKIKGGHSHRFRDTFAVELLLAGVPLETVSLLLGHSSVKITEKHYKPWVRSLQRKLEDDVKRAWSDARALEQEAPH